MKEKRRAQVFSPGEYIEDELEARGWNQVDFAEIIGLPTSVVSNIISGKRPLTPEIATMIADAFGTSAELWLNLESIYRLSQTKQTDSNIARRSKIYQLAPVKELIKREWINPTKDTDSLEKNILEFYGMKNINDPLPNLAHAARKGAQEITPSHTAWLLRVKKLASMVHAEPYSDSSFNRCLEQLKALLHDRQEIRHVPKILAKNGIRFLIVEHLPHTRIDGVTFWLDSQSPVIAISLRYDRIDWFWFTIAHELGHVYRKDGLNDRPYLDINLMDETAEQGDEKAESEANYFATEFLVGHEELQDFILRVGPLYAKQKISNFADRIKVHPGIIVGQLHHRDKVRWNTFRGMLEKVRSIIIPSSLTDGWGQPLRP